MTMARTQAMPAQISRAFPTPWGPENRLMKPERRVPPAAWVATQPYPSHQNRPSAVNLLRGGAYMVRDMAGLMLATRSRGGPQFTVEIG
jgi:hypothetical protein